MTAHNAAGNEMGRNALDNHIPHRSVRSNIRQRQRATQSRLDIDRTLSLVGFRPKADSCNCHSRPAYGADIKWLFADRRKTAVIQPGDGLKSILKPKPTPKASAAALMPIKKVPNPESHHPVSDHRLLIAPITKKTIPVAATHGTRPPAPR